MIIVFKFKIVKIWLKRNASIKRIIVGIVEEVSLSLTKTTRYLMMGFKINLLSITNLELQALTTLEILNIILCNLEIDREH